MLFQSSTLTQSAWKIFYEKFYRLLYNGSEEPTQKVLEKQTERAELYLKFFEQHNIRFNSHLDIGASAGILMQKVRNTYQLQYQYGVEPGSAYSQNANIPGSFMFPSLEQVVQSEKTFDLITACHVLEHIPDPNLFLQQVNKLLSEKGVLFLEVPNAEGNIFSMEFAHPLVFSPLSISSLLAAQGFEITSITEHGLPATSDSRCKKYLAIFAVKNKKKNYTPENKRQKSQLRKKMLRNTFWFENNFIYSIKSPFRYIKFITGKYAI